MRKEQKQPDNHIHPNHNFVQHQLIEMIIETNLIRIFSVDKIITKEGGKIETLVTAITKERITKRELIRGIIEMIGVIMDKDNKDM